MARRLIALGASEERIVTIPMGVDFTRFSKVDRSEQLAGPLRVISVGRLNAEKGHPVLIDAVAAVRACGTELMLTIIGEGSERQAIERQIHELNLSTHVTLLGAQPPERVFFELAAADAFALTGVVAENRQEETQGFAYIEAQATGLPVIASDVGGVSESLVSEKSGILAAERDVKAVADALIAYAEKPELRNEHGSYGAEIVRSKFSLSTMLNSFEKIYADYA